MPEYNEAPVVGNKWTRSYTVHIRNPFKGVPNIEFWEEDIVQTGANSFLNGHKGLIASPFDPAAVIQLLNPDTLQPTGQTMSEGAVYLALFSKYIAMAKARDAAALAAATPQV